MEAVWDDNFVHLKGAYQGQPEGEASFLGIRSLSVVIPTGDNGAFYVGFDNRIRPAQVRVFYVPPAYSLDSVNTIGLIQFGEYRMQNVPLPPYRYSPEIDYKSHYCKAPFISDQQFWPDIMDAKSAYNLLRGGGGVPPPFYAFNARLWNPSATPESFYKFGALNGSLLRMGQGFAQGDSLSASLVAPVGLDIDFLDEQDIIREKRKYAFTKPVFSVDFNEGTLGTGDLMQFILHALNHAEGATDAFTDADIEWVQWSGEHLLVRFYSPENLGPILCIFLDGGKLIAYNFDDYQLRPHTAEANIYTFEQFKAYKEQVKAFGSFIGRDVSPKAARGHDSVPYYDFGTSVVISFRHRTVAYAATTETTTPLAGIEWTVHRKFDFQELEWGPLFFQKPELIWFFKPEEYDLDAYLFHITGPTTPNLPEVRNPKVWFEVPNAPVVKRAIGYGERSTDWLP